MEGELDKFFSERSEEIARQLHDATRRYSYLFDVKRPVAWDDLTEEEQAARVLALQSLAQRGYLILGA